MKLNYNNINNNKNDIIDELNKTHNVTKELSEFENNFNLNKDITMNITKDLSNMRTNSEI